MGELGYITCLLIFIGMATQNMINVLNFGQFFDGRPAVYVNQQAALPGNYVTWFNGLPFSVCYNGSQFGFFTAL